MRVIHGRLFSTIPFLLVALACGSPPGPSASSEARSVETVDGLVKAEIDMPGVLFIREGHGIGGYDAFMIPPAQINYRRGSTELDAALEVEFMAALEQSLFDGADEAEIAVESEPGPCVMMIGVALVNVGLSRSTSASKIGDMTLAMEFRDSTSRQPLLRYATQNVIENPGRGTDREDQIRRSFDEMVQGLNLGGALRAAGLADEIGRPGCEGILAERGRAAFQSMSAN